MRSRSKVDLLLQAISSDPDPYYPQVLPLIVSLLPALTVLVQQVTHLCLQSMRKTVHSWRLVWSHACLGASPVLLAFCMAVLTCPRLGPWPPVQCGGLLGWVQFLKPDTAIWLNSSSGTQLVHSSQTPRIAGAVTMTPRVHCRPRSSTEC